MADAAPALGRGALVGLFWRIPFLVSLLPVPCAMQLFVTRAPLFWVAVIGICLLSSTSLAEIERSGLEGVPRADRGDRCDERPAAGASH